MLCQEAKKGITDNNLFFDIYKEPKSLYIVRYRGSVLESYGQTLGLFICLLTKFQGGAQ